MYSLHVSALEKRAFTACSATVPSGLSAPTNSYFSVPPFHFPNGHLPNPFSPRWGCETSGDAASRRRPLADIYIPSRKIGIGRGYAHDATGRIPFTKCLRPIPVPKVPSRGTVTSAPRTIRIVRNGTRHASVPVPRVQYGPAPSSGSPATLSSLWQRHPPVKPLRPDGQRKRCPQSLGSDGRGPVRSPQRRATRGSEPYQFTYSIWKDYGFAMIFIAREQRSGPTTTSRRTATPIVLCAAAICT
jgi:hypothetical protein